MIKKTASLNVSGHDLAQKALRLGAYYLSPAEISKAKVHLAGDCQECRTDSIELVLNKAFGSITKMLAEHPAPEVFIMLREDDLPKKKQNRLKKHLAICYGCRYTYNGIKSVRPTAQRIKNFIIEEVKKLRR